MPKTNRYAKVHELGLDRAEYDTLINNVSKVLSALMLVENAGEPESIDVIPTQELVLFTDSVETLQGFAGLIKLALEQRSDRDAAVRAHNKIAREHEREFEEAMA